MELSETSKKRSRTLGAHDPLAASSKRLRLREQVNNVSTVQKSKGAINRAAKPTRTALSIVSPHPRFEVAAPPPTSLNRFGTPAKISIAWFLSLSSLMTKLLTAFL